MVDDDPKVLQAFKWSLGKSFDLHLCQGGAEGLRLIETMPFMVVVSDLMMPGMDGIAFLKKVCELAPNTVRMVLTGNATITNAVDAVNNGYIFRFLTKPCPPEILKRAIRDGVRQFEMAKAHGQLQELRVLHGAMEGVVQGLTSLVEVRDPYTAGHQRKVTALAVALAEAMGLDQGALPGLRLAGMVHDIGKLYVPAEFLNKPGRLSDAEFAIIKTHPQVGFDILDPVAFPWPVSRIVVQHHERLDGSGYPHGVRGDDMLLEARILAVADVVDAITTHRPYRPGLGIQMALDELRKYAGVQFDPKVVETCVRLIESGAYVVE